MSSPSRCNKVLPADGPPKKGLFDVDGDGDVDLCDCCRAGFLFIKHSCESLDIYLVGFPIISSVATALALAMLSFQMTGVTMFLDDIEHLSDTIGVELDLGAFHSLLFASACGVLGLNLCVIVNGITAWVARMNRKHSKRGDGKKCCTFVSTATKPSTTHHQNACLVRSPARSPTQASGSCPAGVRRSGRRAGAPPSRRGVWSAVWARGSRVSCCSS